MIAVTWNAKPNADDQFTLKWRKCSVQGSSYIRPCTEHRHLRKKEISASFRNTSLSEPILSWGKEEINGDCQVPAIDTCTRNTRNPYITTPGKPAAMRLSGSFLSIPTRCWVSYSNGFCFRNMIPCSFDDLIYPYYPTYTMGCYQIVISGDNGSRGLTICSAGLRLSL